MTETEVLLDFLHGQRRHVLSAVDGLSAEEMRRAMLPTGWTFVGLINHLAVDVERFWFRGVWAAEPEVIAAYESGPSEAWQVPDERDPADVLAAYRDECERADRIIEATPLDAPPQWWWPGEGSPHLTDLREAVLHVIAETAAHSGHADAARELLDGRTWLMLT